MRRRLRNLGAIAIALLTLTWPKANVPLLLWNSSPSIPIGLYRATPARPAEGNVAIIRLPDKVRQFADRRGYLPSSALLIKPVVAGAGDMVCRHGLRVEVNGRTRAIAKPRDRRGQILPHWQGCIRLAESQIFVLAAAVGDSFDSRYVGPIDGDAVLGTGTALWTR